MTSKNTRNADLNMYKVLSICASAYQLYLLSLPVLHLDRKPRKTHKGVARAAQI